MSATLAGPAATAALGAVILSYIFCQGTPSTAEARAAQTGGPPAGVEPPVSSKPGDPSAQTPMVNPDGYTSARVCGECHTDIYNSWKRSLHAFSLSDPIFDTAFMQAVKEEGDQARRLCLMCHAPMTMMNADYELSAGVTRDGVSCDFCHTVTAVHLDRPDRPYDADVGATKRGIIKKAESPAHQVAYSELHGKSEFCGGCHNFVAPSGAVILGTYDEWKAGPYSRRGVQCQDCHMVLSTGKVVREEIRQSGSQIHLHDLIHDSDQLRSALAIRIENAGRTSSGLTVDVVVENVGSGHMVPTGIPSREVILTVTAESGSYTKTSERRYQKIVADGRGRVLTQDYEILLRGARIITDNRIAPAEKRAERFYFAPPPSGSVKVTATISYRYAPLVLREQLVNVKLGQAERYVQ